jgi:hypothetical protein
MTIKDLLTEVESEVEVVGYSTEEDSYTTIPNDEIETYYDYGVAGVYVPNNSSVIVIEFYLD